MKLRKVIIGLLIALIVSLAFGTTTTYSYGHTCMKCLSDKSVSEKKLFGITFDRKTTASGSPADYERIFGGACTHVFRKSGFGRTEHSLLCTVIGCGKTAEGTVVRPRIEAVTATYTAESRLHDRDLALATFQLIDTLMPPNTGLEHRDDISEKAQSTLFGIGYHLRHAKTIEEWRAVLDAARQNFSDKSNLPKE